MNNLPDTPNGWDQYHQMLNNIPPVAPPSDMGFRIANAVENANGKGKGPFGFSWRTASGVAALAVVVALCVFFFGQTESTVVAPVKGTATVERAAKKSVRSKAAPPADTSHFPSEVPALQIPSPPDNLGYPADTFTIPTPATQHQPTTGPGRKK
ncbi:MAG: hypothetical protein JNJ94_10995 [Chlorobi bacterium]|jgi:hypothetical protein|nr:hypothetical protein [Chlorobiota bacterium]